MLIITSIIFTSIHRRDCCKRKIEKEIYGKGIERNHHGKVDKAEEHRSKEKIVNKSKKKFIEER